MKWSNEPVLLSAIVAGVLAATGGGLALLDAGASLLAAGALWLGQLSIVIGGGTIARTQAYGPKTAEDIMEADTFMRERGV